MKLEVLISTMYQNDLSLIKKMNIKSNALIINQCNMEEMIEKHFDGNTIRMLSCKERGLSKSRNKAIENSIGDICVIADDDLIYNDNYEKIILDAYKKYPDTSIIVFDVPSTNPKRPTSILKEGRIDFLHSFKVSSFQITFRKKDIVENGLLFNEFFGAGAKYTCGEENIFLVEALKKKLKIRYVKTAIAIVNHGESTWFTGFNEQLLKSKGAMFYEMSHRLSFFLILQFALRKYKLYKNAVSLYDALHFMKCGLYEYKNFLNEDNGEHKNLRGR